ncbi:alpha/beta-hydrolase [Trametes elegans]|nr:alpha/beta-hydrolase [Trametes elegans]
MSFPQAHKHKAQSPPKSRSSNTVDYDMAAEQLDDAYEKSHIKIPSATPGWSLDAWKYLPRRRGSTQAAQGLPVIIMAHGVSANKLMGLAPYAEAFTALGYAAVVFDYRRWGASAGTPRHVVYVSEQLEDYRTVIKFCRQQPEFNPQQVILWGTSFAGGHVVTLASERLLNLSAVIAQCPYLGTSPTPALWPFIKLVLRGVEDVLRQTVGMYPKYIPAVAETGEVGLLTSPGSTQGMLGIVKDKQDYPNEVSASSFFELPFYNPNASAPQITCPVLVVAAEHDNICQLSAASELQRLSPNVELVVLPCSHFELYPGSRMHEESLNAMKDFLIRHLQRL